MKIQIQNSSKAKQEDRIEVNASSKLLDKISLLIVSNDDEKVNYEEMNDMTKNIKMVK